MRGFAMVLGVIACISCAAEDDLRPQVEVFPQYDTFIVGEMISVRIRVTAPKSHSIERLTANAAARLGLPAKIVASDNRVVRGFSSGANPNANDYEVLKAGETADITCPIGTIITKPGQYTMSISPNVVWNFTLSEVVLPIKCISIDDVKTISRVPLTIRSPQLNQRDFELLNISMAKDFFLVLHSINERGETLGLTRLWNVDADCRVLALAQRLDRPLSEEIWMTYCHESSFWFARVDVYGATLERRKLVPSDDAVRSVPVQK